MDSDRGILVNRLSTSNATINISKVWRSVISLTKEKCHKCKSCWVCGNSGACGGLWPAKICCWSSMLVRINNLTYEKTSWVQKFIYLHNTTCTQRFLTLDMFYYYVESLAPFDNMILNWEQSFSVYSCYTQLSLLTFGVITLGIVPNCDICRGFPCRLSIDSL